MVGENKRKIKCVNENVIGICFVLFYFYFKGGGRGSVAVAR